jgi:hypothetical protein
MPLIPHWEKLPGQSPAGPALRCRLDEAFEAAQDRTRIVLCSIHFPGQTEPGWAHLTYQPEGVRPSTGHFSLLVPERIEGPLLQWVLGVPNPEAPPDFQLAGSMEAIGSVTIYRDRSISLSVRGAQAQVSLSGRCFANVIVADSVDGRYVLTWEIESPPR